MAKKIKLIDQFDYEKKLNIKYMWILYGLSIFMVLLYGFIFKFLNSYYRKKRSRDGLLIKNYKFFKFLKYVDSFNSCFSIRNPITSKKYYYQPSIVLFFGIYIMFNLIFFFKEVELITYEPRSYIVGKRIGRISCISYSLCNFFVLRHDPVGKITGIPQDKLNMIHRWLGRWAWLLVGIHAYFNIIYWLDINMIIMVQIPPQIFGMIAFGSMTVLTWGGVGIIRRWHYEFFLIHHGFFAFVAFLLSVFHNTGGRVFIILGYFVVFLDRVLFFSEGIINKYFTPTKGISSCKILDENGETVEVKIPLSQMSEKTNILGKFIPTIRDWKAGQHVFLKIPKIRFLQSHPFTVASISSMGEVHLLIRTRNGFTKKLMKRIEKDSAAAAETDPESVTGSKKIIHLKAIVRGPYGGDYISLLPFDVVSFIGGGSGTSFTFPVCLDLLLKIKERDSQKDFMGRPEKAKIRFVWFIRELKNVCWYEDQLNLLYDLYRDANCSADLKIQLYITRKPSQISTVTTNDVEPVSTEKMIMRDTKKEIHEVTDTSCSNSNSSSSKHEFEGIELNGINIPKFVEIIYGRPPPLDIIREDSIKLNDNKTGLSSMAVLSCGPVQLTADVQAGCQRCRWDENAPNIYCYTEKYSI